jgi:predicted transposase/invertase (TIGR01784 family)
MHTQDTSEFTISPGLAKATGTIDYGFTNDYMFRAIFQKNQKVLKSLICSLLHLENDDIKHIRITNPIELGQSIESKDFILDITVELNDDRLINLEMQVQNQYNWQERSLTYLCRTFDQLNQGQDYSEVKSAIHIGFVDFSPFPDFQEFYATYKLLNVKNQHLYTDKFTLCVVDLTHINLATEEDKKYRIDHWARLFKATTWEELKMAAKNNPELLEASEALYTLNADEMIRQQCQARADYNRHHNMINLKMDEMQNTIDEQADTINEQADTINEQADTINEQADQINNLSDQIADKDAEIERLRAQLAQKEK